MSDETLGKHGRRDFMVAVAGSSFLVACGGSNGGASTALPAGAEPGAGGASADGDTTAIPRARPDDWDAIAFNRERGNAGAIPVGYRDDINGPDGPTAHLGKHLPYVPSAFDGEVPASMLALMWGDPERGHARHPNAVPGPANDGEGHWYDSVRVRKATEGEAEEAETTFTSWPEQGPDGTGRYAVLGGGEITADDGKNTVYLVRLPSDVRSGDVVRVHAHCLTHGEYVDFLTVP